ncbi:hypothetical protein AKJ09_08319 [Labilithrix luteola]|uniref:Uncharacterized protein n=1 Tax=Labilithrix luteola TaxID=1391654 RepID=A0A0K1Q745_9BACT|nr:hypothetical protein [Labilithrix luteola]AKV01656.1 hypothetical protein AKJ09_08319 [Labilithrix luteola]
MSLRTAALAAKRTVAELHAEFERHPTDDNDYDFEAAREAWLATLVSVVHALPRELLRDESEWRTRSEKTGVARVISNAPRVLERKKIEPRHLAVVALLAGVPCKYGKRDDVQAVLERMANAVSQDVKRRK